MKNLRKPWTYSGLNEQESQPLPAPKEFIKMCGVTSANHDSIRAMESLILEKLCMHINTTKKKNLLNETLNLLQKGTF